jgi:hypothetical protein
MSEIVLEQIPKTGKINLTIQVSTEINYSAEVAKRLAGRFVANEISYLLRAGDPTLVVADRLYWRVPILLAFPTTGLLGTVGTVDVDVETGQIPITPAEISEITHYAESLAAEHTSTECTAP